MIKLNKRLRKKLPVLSFYFLGSALVIHIIIILSVSLFPGLMQYTPKILRYKYLRNTMVGPLFSTDSFFCLTEWVTLNETKGTQLYPQITSISGFHENYLQPKLLFQGRFEYWLGKTYSKNGHKKQNLDRYVLTEYPEFAKEGDSIRHVMLSKCLKDNEQGIPPDTIKIIF